MGLCADVGLSRSGTNNSAMFAEIVPEQLRSAVYAFDRSFEGAVGATAAPLVGLVAERVFGYQGSLGGKRGPCASPGAGQCPGPGQQHAHSAAGALGAGPHLLHCEPIHTCLCRFLKSQNN